MNPIRCLNCGVSNPNNGLTCTACSLRINIYTSDTVSKVTELPKAWKTETQKNHELHQASLTKQFQSHADAISQAIQKERARITEELKALPDFGTIACEAVILKIVNPK